MQNKWYKMECSYHLTNDSQPVPQQWLQKPELRNFVNFAKSPVNIELLEKFKLLDQKRFELMENRNKKKNIHKVSVTSMLWMISIGHLGCLSDSSAECEKLEKGPWFHSNDWEHQYYQHPSPT